MQKQDKIAAEFDFTPKLYNRKSGKVCPSDAQIDLMQKLTLEGKKWRVRLMHSAGFPLIAYDGTQAMLDSVEKQKKYNLMTYIPVI